MENLYSPKELSSSRSFRLLYRGIIVNCVLYVKKNSILLSFSSIFSDFLSQIGQYNSPKTLFLHKKQRFWQQYYMYLHVHKDVYERWHCILVTNLPQGRSGILTDQHVFICQGFDKRLERLRDGGLGMADTLHLQPIDSVRRLRTKAFGLDAATRQRRHAGISTVKLYWAKKSKNDNMPKN